VARYVIASRHRGRPLNSVVSRHQMSREQWAALMLVVAVALGAIIIRLVRRSRPAIESYRKTPGGPWLVRRYVEFYFYPMSWARAAKAVVLAAVVAVVATYLGWLAW
jgi:hypothetical protein